MFLVSKNTPLYPETAVARALALPCTPPYPCAHTQSLTNLPLYLPTSSLIHQLPSTGTTSPKVLTTATHSLPGLQPWPLQSFPCSAMRDLQKHKSNLTPLLKSSQDPPQYHLLTGALHFILCSSHSPIPVPLPAVMDLSLMVKPDRQA